MKLHSLALLTIAATGVSAAPAGTAGFTCPDSQTLAYSCFQNVGSKLTVVGQAWTQAIQCGSNGCECVSSCSGSSCLEPITATLVKASNDYTLALSGHVTGEISYKAGPEANVVSADSSGNYPYAGKKDISHIDICLNPSAETVVEVVEEPVKTPTLELVKLSGPPGGCGGDMSAFEDEVYTLPSSTSDWIHCYKITVSAGDFECLVDMTLTDLAPGGVGNMTAVEGPLCPGSTVYVSSKVNSPDMAPEDSTFAYVDAKGEVTGSHVTCEDEGAIAVIDEPSPILTPAIELAKYAGPVGSCGVDMTLYEDDVYTLPSSSSEWIYCYEISIPAGDFECIVDMTVTDVADGGIGNKAPVAGSLCPGEVSYLATEANPASLAPEGPVHAVVEGSGELSGNRVTQEDDASVVAAVEEVPVEEEPRAEEPTVNEESSCPGVELYAVNGVQVSKGSAGNFGSAANFPITVVSQNTETVTFELCEGSTVYTGFLENSEYKCFGSDSTSGCQTYTADCVTEGKFAVVDLHMLSPVTGDQPLVNVPECCIPEQPESAVYVFVLECVPC